MITPRDPSSVTGSCLAMTSAHNRSTLKVPVRFTAMTLLQTSIGKGPSRPRVFAALPIPAQFTLIWMVLKADTAASIPAFAESSSTTFTFAKTQLSAPSSATIACPASSFRSKMTTLPPAVAMRRVTACPIPEAPPVTTATFPLISMC